MKQVIVIRKDLDLPKGKMAVQVAHASVKAVRNSREDTVQRWEDEGMKKVVVYVNDKDELFKIQNDARRNGLVSSVVRDAGKTVVDSGTVTCVGIGPGDDETVDGVTGDLQLVG
mgnify:CR=1 FL=1